VALQILSNWADRELVGFRSPYVDQHKACVISEQNKRICIVIIVCYFLDTPALDFCVFLLRVRQDPRYLLQLVVNKNVLVVVPRDGQVLIGLELYHLVYKLVRFETQITQLQVALCYVDEMKARVTAYQHLARSEGHFH
jgi:hypothetical protein